MNGLAPSEFAEKCLEAYETYGSKSAASEHLNVSTATVTRYMRLLDLSKEDLKKVDSGELPVSTRKRSRPKKAPETNTRVNALLDILEHTVFATQSQLENCTGNSFAVNRDAIDLGVRKGLINKETAYKPYAYSLTTKGANMIGAQLPKHFMSDAAIHQRLLRNDIEIAARKQNSHNHFVSRPALWRRGLYPTLGEWCLQFEDKEGQTKMALILIDDYGMPASRLRKILDRNHSVKVDPKTKKTTVNKVIEKNAPDKKNMTWRKAISRFVLHSTSEYRINKYQRYVQKHESEFKEMMPLFRVMTPIWDVGV